MRSSPSEEQAAIGIAKQQAKQNRSITDPSDIAVIKTKHIHELADFVRSLSLTEAEFADGFAVDCNETDFEYDLYNVIMDSPRIDTAKKRAFCQLFRKCVRFYEMNDSKRQLDKPKHHGISILKSRSSPSFTDRQRTMMDELEHYKDTVPSLIPSRVAVTV